MVDNPITDILANYLASITSVVTRMAFYSFNKLTCWGITCETFHNYIEMLTIKDNPIYSDVINFMDEIFQKLI